MGYSSRHIAVVGAGVSGVAAAAHLKAAGLEVTVFERSSVAGGVWYVIVKLLMLQYETLIWFV